MLCLLAYVIRFVSVFDYVKLLQNNILRYFASCHFKCAITFIERTHDICSHAYKYELYNHNNYINQINLRLALFLFCVCHRVCQCAR